MRTIIVGRRPADIEAVLDRRRALGLDRLDEVWEGEYHMAPAPGGAHAHVDFQLVTILAPLAARAGLRGATICNIGEPTDYRVPDQAYFVAGTPLLTFHPTAALVVEVVSPGDESRDKFDFYFDAGVVEVAIVDPQSRGVAWYVRTDAGFILGTRSRLLDIASRDLAEQIDWP